MASSEFVPRIPFVAAEHQVDYLGHNSHIIEQRHKLEQACKPASKRIASLIVDLELTPQRQLDQLAAHLETGLGRTARFGYREARREIEAQRAGGKALAWSVLDPGRHGELARDGLEGLRLLIRRRALETAAAISEAAQRAAHATDDPILRTAAAIAAAGQTLHNHVLELIGETLNMGRTAGALSLDEPPQFAMRSEQLDENTCDGCTEVHGLIVQVDSPEYYDLMPPSECYGGGRCRGLYVYGDSRDEITA